MKVFEWLMCVALRVQDTDNLFFESFTALSWKPESRRLMVLKDVEVKAELQTQLPIVTASCLQTLKLNKKEVRLLRLFNFG